MTSRKRKGTRWAECGGDGDGCKKKLSGKTGAHVKPCIASAYKSQPFVLSLAKAFKSANNLVLDDGCTLHDDPFLCCELSSFVESDQFLHSLQEELSDIDYNKRNNDLFSFFQSDDLKHSTTPYLSSFKEFMEGEVSPWLTSVTGISFDSKVDIISSRYEFTDVLLCHDDELEGRKIAYMLYLVPGWEESDGGAFDLFNTTDGNQPKEIVKSIYPKWNKFVFFEVSPKSFHQVSEVLTEDKIRLSLNGWFYAPTEPRVPQPRKVPLYLEPALDAEAVLLSKWINPLYLKLETQLQIRTKFEDDSEIQLNGFLNVELYDKVCEELKEASIGWQSLGPPTKRHYDVAKPETLSATLKELRLLFASEPFFIFLSSLTGLNLDGSTAADGEDEEEEAQSDSLEERSFGKCHIEVKRWKWKCYTLLHDTSHENRAFCLDAHLFCGCAEWKPEYGGFLSYVADGDEDELLNISPSENAFALVYREAETNAFVKYINKNITLMNTRGEFNSISAIYVEQ